jgi:FKBP-type peptidyl-prolyl cis-trans isomerase (trigger factor)
MVEKQIKPEYLKMAFMEEAINASIKDVIKHHEDKKFIGQPYDLSDEKKEDILILTYKLDTYPEVEVKNDSWRNLAVSAVNTSITQEEIDQALTNLIKQYADYSDAESI